MSGSKGSNESKYAIIQSGGKQYRVTEGLVIDVELLRAEIGASVEFAEVLFVHNGSQAIVGSPRVEGAIVRGELVDCVSGPKVKSLKYKPNHNTCRRFGHRQHYSRIKITEVVS